MKYRIAIPSYKRHNILKEKTLRYLNECGIPSNIIDVFVANKEEYEVYTENIPSNLYNKIIIGKETLHKQRNYIREYYPKNTLLFNLDDDIEQLETANECQLDKISDNLNKIIEFGFHLLKKEKTKLLGIYGARNYFFMSNDYSRGLYYCIGSCFWTINDKDHKLDVKLEDKEDYERTIKSYLKYGHIIRLNNITAKTGYYTTQGGMQETRTPERIKKSGKYLIQRYPNLCEENTARKEHFEIKFKKQKNNKKVKFGR